ncbi:MAG: hypothetical protein AWT59_3238 [Candidatus Gallionella acididurans]|uniref:Uncharacterized protein n=1 Tax=Candidatus Gallionella acididurans TaxID=1796491 RepID=A0A139BPL3_9PROT|nr:MAG: hypothetical protein AWT59_3238 [Candidatus Gallionella acididurans]
MAAHRPKEDVLVHYDEELGELVFYTIPTSTTGALRAKAFGGVRPPVSQLQALEPQEAMRRVGGTVLAFLDLSSIEKLDITKEFMAKADEDESDL